MIDNTCYIDKLILSFIWKINYVKTNLKEMYGKKKSINYKINQLRYK